MAVRINKGIAMQQLPVVPLVDTVLNLLIFFLVTTKFAEADRIMEGALADAETAKPVTSAPEAVFIDINPDGRFYMKGFQRALTSGEVQQALSAAAWNNPRVPVTIRPAKGCRWEAVVAAMNACKKAKIRTYDFAVGGATPGPP